MLDEGIFANQSGFEEAVQELTDAKGEPVRKTDIDLLVRAADLVAKAIQRIGAQHETLTTSGGESVPATELLYGMLIDGFMALHSNKSLRARGSSMKFGGGKAAQSVTAKFGKSQKPEDPQESYYRRGSRLSEGRQREFNKRRYYY